MGRNMCLRLSEKEVPFVGFDIDAAACHEARAAGIPVAETLDALFADAAAPKTVWLMVPSRHVEESIAAAAPFLQEGDTVIDGGNSFYKDSQRRHGQLQKEGIQFIDCGTSGGLAGARGGASLMVGGEAHAVHTHETLFVALAKENGYAHVGGVGAGHFVKMVHNGIEYGMMGALAEGMNALHQHRASLEISLEHVLAPYEHGSIIESRLMSWLAEAYREGGLEQISGEVPRGETEAEMEHLTTIAPTPVLEAALLQRRATRTTPSYTGTLIALMRNKFGGHHTAKK